MPCPFPVPGTVKNRAEPELSISDCGFVDTWCECGFLGLIPGNSSATAQRGRGKWCWSSLGRPRAFLSVGHKGTAGLDDTCHPRLRWTQHRGLQSKAGNEKENRVGCIKPRTFHVERGAPAKPNHICIPAQQLRDRALRPKTTNKRELFWRLAKI